MSKEYWRQETENLKIQYNDVCKLLENLKELNEEMLRCMIFDFNANVKQFGLATAKRLNSRYVIEKATGKSIEEVINEI